MSADQLGNLLGRLDEVRTLRSARYRILFLCTLIGLFGFLFIAFSALDIAFKLPVVPRAVASATCLVAMLLALTRLIQVGLRQRREYRGVAAEVERVYPQIETALSTSVEFGGDPDRTRRLSSEGIVEALVADTRVRTGALDFLTSINWGRVRIAVLWFVLVVLLCSFYSTQHTRLARLTFLRLVTPWRDVPAPTLTLAEVHPARCEVRKLGDMKISAYLSGKLPRECRIVYSTFDPDKPQAKPSPWQNEPMTQQGEKLYTFHFSRLTESVRFRVKAGDFRSDECLIDVYEAPRVVRINMKLVYPAYCGLGEKEIKDSIGPITALRGTVVQIHAFANKPLRRAGIRFSQGEPDYIAAAMSQPDELLAQFTITRNDRYKIWLADAHGRVNEDAVFYTIKALEDERPVVKIVRPKKEIKVKKTTEVPLELEATDDYGVKEVGIAYKIKTDDAVRVPIDEFVERIKKARSGDTLFLEEMGLADTDIVTFYAYAIDNDTVSGPKVGRSELHFIEITPYAQQYKRKESKSGSGKKEEKKDENFIPKLDDIIKAQRKVLAKTFHLDSTLPAKPSEAQVTEIVDLGSTEDALRARTELLARRLVENLMKLGLEEQIDRAEHMVRGSNEMGIAAYVLAKLSTSSAIRYENTGLYHLYRAKRDLIKLIQETKDPKLRQKLEQALSAAGKQQQDDVEQDIERELEELRAQAKQIEKMRDKQKDLNRKMQQMASEKIRKERGESKPKAEAANSPKPGDVARKQQRLAKEAEARTSDLRRMDQKSDKLSFAPAREMDQAAYEMQKAAEALRRERLDEGRDRGKKADEHMKHALREVKRSMERSLAQQLKDAAERTRELAERQRELGKQTQRQAQQPPQTQPREGQQRAQGQPQQGQQQAQQPAQTQPREGQQRAQGQPQQGQQQAQQPAQTQPREGQRRAQGQPQQGQQQAQRPRGSKSEGGPDQKLARQQKDIREDLHALGGKLKHLGQRAKETDPEIGQQVQKMGDEATEGKVQEEMAKARRELEAKRPAAARRPQAEAKKHLDKLARDVREAAEQFAMDDDERLARAIERTEKLAKKQEGINKDMAQAELHHSSSPTRKRQTAKAAKDQEAARQEVGALAKQVDRIRALQEAGMDEQIRETVQKAAEAMRAAQQKMVQNDPKGAERKGIEVRKELDQTTKALRQQMREALSHKLAKAVETASKAVGSQQSAKAETQQAAKQQAKRGRPSKPAQATPQQRAAQEAERQAAQKAGQDQGTAREQTEKLGKDLEAIQRQAKKTHPEMARDVERIARDMRARQPLRRMTDAQRELQRQQYRSAERHQDAAAQTMGRAHARLSDLYQDSTSKPLQTLKAAEREATELKKDLDQLQKRTDRLARRPARTPPSQPSQADRATEKELSEVRQKQAQAQDRAERFADRMERMKPSPQDKQALTEMKGKMTDASAKLGQRKLKQAASGIGESRKIVQDIGEGIIKRIKRIVDERKRKEPSEEHAPDEYRELVKRYYEALSAK